MTETMPTSEVLNRAADLIEERGWGKGPFAMSADEGVICVMGAIYASQHGRLLRPEECRIDAEPYDLVAHCPAGEALDNYLALRCPLFMWNDVQPDGSVVIETLRACAVIEASRELETAEVSA